MNEASVTVVLKNKYGMHVRPAGLFAKTAARYRADVTVEKDGVVFGAIVTQLLGKLKDGGMDLGVSFACMGAVVAVAVILQLLFLKPQSDNME